MCLVTMVMSIFSFACSARPGVRQVPEGSGEQGKMEKTGCKIICGAPTTLAVKGLMMMMMMIFSPHAGQKYTSRLQLVFAVNKIHAFGDFE